MSTKNPLWGQGARWSLGFRLGPCRSPNVTWSPNSADSIETCEYKKPSHICIRSESVRASKGIRLQYQSLAMRILIKGGVWKNTEVLFSDLSLVHSTFLLYCCCSIHSLHSCRWCLIQYRKSIKGQFAEICKRILAIKNTPSVRLLDTDSWCIVFFFHSTFCMHHPLDVLKDCVSRRSSWQSEYKEQDGISHIHPVRNDSSCKERASKALKNPNAILLLHADHMP